MRQGETVTMKTAAMKSVLLLACLSCCMGVASTPSATKGKAMTKHAKGTFDVKMLPQEDKGGDASLGRFLLDKTYHGELEASGKGQMLTAGTEVQGSAAYVAVEKVSGTLAGHKGGFALHHIGVMNRGAPNLAIGIVPDSGNGELKGIAGTLTIDIVEGKHYYDLAYTLP
jgi:hypothetical protein